MPIFKIEVNEYMCIKCGYKWINRINGKDGPVPKRCAKCKRANWDQGRISREEVGLRRRIKFLNEFYKWSSFYWNTSDEMRDASILNAWDFKLAERFLNINPRPTETELKDVLAPPNFVVNVDSQKQYTRRGYVPIPEKPGRIRYDRKAFIEFLKNEARKRQKIMWEIIRSREPEEE